MATPFEIYQSSYDYLHKGDYTNGFKYFEYRWHPETLEFHKKVYPEIDVWDKLSPAPVWQGQNLFDKSIVIQMEMGYGDCIQLARYIPILKCYGARRVIVLQTKSLHNLISQFNCVDHITNNEKGTEVQNADYWIGSFSLPFFAINGPNYIKNLFATTKDHVFGRDGYLDAIPYELYGDIKIGVNWQASKQGGFRNFSVEEFDKIQKAIPKATFYSINPLDDGPFKSLHDTKWKEDWAETSRYITAMDYVISVDTGTVHLSGALGIKTLMIQPEPNKICWRWKYPGWYKNVVKFDNKTAIPKIISHLRKVCV